jgi:hypothetical protein
MVRWRVPDLYPAAIRFWDDLLLFTLAFRNDSGFIQRVTTDPGYRAFLQQIYVMNASDTTLRFPQNYERILLSQASI